MAQLAVIGHEGDTKVIWDRNNADEVANARETFDALRAKGFAAFSVKDDGERNVRLDAFDPAAEKIILVPRMQGG
jgi:hypothetical protein